MVFRGALYMYLPSFLYLAPSLYKEPHTHRNLYFSCVDYVDGKYDLLSSSCHINKELQLRKINKSPSTSTKPPALISLHPLPLV